MGPIFGHARHMTDLYRLWSHAWKALGAHTSGDDLFTALLAKYDEPHRHYHSRQHLIECLQHFDAVRHLPVHAAEVEVALWFHDAVYDLQRSDNEARSADWARAACLEGGVPVEVADRVQALILATRHTAVPTGLDEQVLIDIDLAILGAPAARFAEYERQIRAEYAWVPEAVFKSRRRAILQSFLDRSPLYSTAHFHAALDRTARDNLRYALGEDRA